MSSNARRHLQCRGQSWYVKVKVPRDLQASVGGAHIKKSLGTRDLAKANVRKSTQIREIEAMFDRLRKESV